MSKLSKRFNISIAGLVIEVNTVSLSTSLLCYDYICSGKPDLSVYVSNQDVKREIELDVNEKKMNVGFYETLAVYRKIVNSVIPFDIFLIHGAAVALGKEAVLFSAPSRTGKTTHIKLWLQNLKGSYIVNGDKPLLKMKEEQAIVCGTPWCGKEQLGTNTMVPLKAIIFMERAEDNRIDEISFSQAYPFLLSQMYLPDNLELAKKTLNIVSQLYGKVRFYKFFFNNFKDDCFNVSYNTLIEFFVDKTHRPCNTTSQPTSDVI